MHDQLLTYDYDCNITARSTHICCFLLVVNDISRCYISRSYYFLCDF